MSVVVRRCQTINFLNIKINSFELSWKIMTRFWFKRIRENTTQLMNFITLISSLCFYSICGGFLFLRISRAIRRRVYEFINWWHVLWPDVDFLTLIIGYQLLVTLMKRWMWMLNLTSFKLIEYGFSTFFWKCLLFTNKWQLLSSRADHFCIFFSLFSPHALQISSLTFAIISIVHAVDPIYFVQNQKGLDYKFTGKKDEHRFGVELTENQQFHHTVTGWLSSNFV